MGKEKQHAFFFFETTKCVDIYICRACENMPGKWEYQDEKSKAGAPWLSFDPTDNSRLESAFLATTTTTTTTTRAAAGKAAAPTAGSVTLDFSGKTFTVDLAKKRMTGPSKSDTTFVVRRCDVGQSTAEIDDLLNQLCGGPGINRLMTGEDFARVFRILGVNGDGVDAFVLFFKAGAATPQSIDREELRTLFTVHGINLREPKAAARQVATWNAQLMTDTTEFNKFYDFVWLWNRASPTAAIVCDITDIWKMLLGGLKLSLTAKWFEFVASHAKLSGGVTRDLWNSSLRFLRKVSPSLVEYDEDDCWPLMIDEFVTKLKASPL